MSPVVSLDDVGVRFRLSRRNRHRRGGPRQWTTWGVRHVDLQVDHGEIVGVIGPNGAGKSSLLRIVAGIYQPDEGHVRVEGRVAPLISPSAGFSRFLTGWENVELSASLLGLSLAEARSLKPEVAALAGLGEFMDAPTRAYSAGMRARLGFAIAVASDPDILVLDEVMAAVDEEFRERSEATLGDFIRRGRTVIFATHDVATVAETCTRLVRMGDGSVVEEGDPGPIAAAYLRESHHADPGNAASGHKSLAALVRKAAEGRQ